MKHQLHELTKSRAGDIQNAISGEAWSKDPGPYQEPPATHDDFGPYDE